MPAGPEYIFSTKLSAQKISAPAHPLLLTSSEMECGPGPDTVTRDPSPVPNVCQSPLTSTFAVCTTCPSSFSVTENGASVVLAPRTGYKLTLKSTVAPSGMASPPPTVKPRNPLPPAGNPTLPYTPELLEYAFPPVVATV